VFGYGAKKGGFGMINKREGGHRGIQSNNVIRTHLNPREKDVNINKGMDKDEEKISSTNIYRKSFIENNDSNPIANLIEPTGVNDIELFKARATLLFVSALYGTNFGCVKILGEHLDPSFSASIRFILAFSVFLPFMLDKSVINGKKNTLVLGGVEVGLYAGIGYWAQAIALETAHAGTVAFICSLAVLVVPLLDVLFGRRELEKPWYRQFIPAILATGGVACLELGGSEIPGIGDLYAFVQPIVFGLSFWRVEKFMSEDIKEQNDPRIFTGGMMLGVASVATVWCMHDFMLPPMEVGGYPGFLEVMNSQMTSFTDLYVLAALLWTGLITTAMTSFGENIAMQRLSAAESTVIYSTEPLFGAAFAAVALDEHMGWNTLFGAILILTSCLWSSLGPELIFELMVSALGSASGLVGEEAAAEILQNLNANWKSVLDFMNLEDKLP
tara:strand:+ start:535 stop:1863 length:1329 start_codon:yes stop_codon:yes gene_type:complete